MYTTAVVTTDLEGCFYAKEVAVSQQLREDALLAMNVPMWPHVI